jgi:ATP-binding cassette, subfamily C, bacterial
MSIGDAVNPQEGKLSAAAGALVRDFASTSGRKGLFAIVYVVAGAFLEGAGISLLVPLLGLIFNTNAMPHWLQHGAAALFALFAVHTPFARLVVLLSLFSVLMALRALVISARNMAIFEVQAEFIEIQRLRIVKNLAAARWEYIARLRHSRIMHLMSGDIQRLGIGIQFVLSGGTAGAMLLVQCALACFLSPVLAMIVLVLLIVGTIALGPMLAKARRLGGYVADANLSLLNSTAQFLAGLKLAISQNLEAGFVDEIGQTLRDLSDRQVSYTKQDIRSQVAFTTLSAIVGASLVLAGIGWLHIAPAVLFTLLIVVARMIAPVGQIQNGAQQFAHVLAIYERMRDFERELAAAARDGEALEVAAPIPQGGIEFENVSFRHSNANDNASEPESGGGLRNIRLTIAPGEFLAITGPSGAGKTTFADLLVGLYPPHSGRILVGGKVLDSATREEWRNSLSYVSQDAFLFHGTIRRNLSWACPGASETDMWRALSMSGADDLVRRMENGLDTVVGERGTLVSGGERQRIALARAILRRPRLLLLDEATGAIDSDGERIVFTNLRTITPAPTIVLIAHRMENLGICDRIIRLEPEESAGGTSTFEQPAMLHSLDGVAVRDVALFGNDGTVLHTRHGSGRS